MSTGTVVYTVMVQNPTWADHASFTTYAEALDEATEMLPRFGIGTASWKIEKRVLANVAVLPTA